ncbi:MAG: hypothetical protein RI957_1497 [Verrucomicrobiota bacterium]|jgi:hypothetical protein
MTDAFSQFQWPRKLIIDEASLREAYRMASKEAQSEAAQAALTKAYEILRSPASRLRHWLELHGLQGETRGVIDGELVDWFGQVGAVIQESDALLRRRDQCQSALARAMMEKEMQGGRARIEEWQGRLREWLARKTALFAEIEAGHLNAAEAWACVRDLGFIEKWQQQLRERYGKFF